MPLPTNSTPPTFADLGTSTLTEFTDNAPGEPAREHARSGWGAAPLDLLPRGDRIAHRSGVPITGGCSSRAEVVRATHRLLQAGLLVLLPAWWRGDPRRAESAVRRDRRASSATALPTVIRRCQAILFLRPLMLDNIEKNSAVEVL